MGMVFHFDGSSDLPSRLFKVEVLATGPVPEYAREVFARKYPGREDFFYPSSARLYRSVSAARARADLLRDCGCVVAVYECRPEWTVSETQREKINRLEEENARLRGLVA